MPCFWCERNTEIKSGRNRPRPGRVIALAGLETLLVISWTILGASLLALLWSGWYLAVPVFYLFALSVAAEVESNSRRSPATALGITIHGERTYGMKLLRIGLTPPMLLLGMAGYIRCFRGGFSLPESITGTDFRELDLQLDPRPQAIILAGRTIAKRWVTAYTVSALLVAGAMFVLSVLVIHDENPSGTHRQETEMSESDRELLALYLELSALHPDELEYHVRLASLYHRNSMNSDLQFQLEEIRRLNPEHAMLVLADTSEISVEDLITPRTDSLPAGPIMPEALSDSSAAPGDSAGPAASGDSTGFAVPGDYPGSSDAAFPSEPVEQPATRETGENQDPGGAVPGREQEGAPENAEPAAEPDSL